jgi:hypothetical protein
MLEMTAKADERLHGFSLIWPLSTITRRTGLPFLMAFTVAPSRVDLMAVIGE